jgi:23S rRNA A1618 N6-methylase RlmF
MVLVSVVENVHRFDFTMCNPPFYSSSEDIARSAEGKEYIPHGVRPSPLRPQDPIDDLWCVGVYGS